MAQNSTVLRCRGLLVAIACALVIAHFNAVLHARDDLSRLAITECNGAHKPQLSIPQFEKMHRMARLSRRASGLLVVHMDGGWGNQFQTLVSSLPMAVALNRTLIFVYRRPEMIAGSLQANKIDWSPWNGTDVFSSTNTTFATFNTANMSEAEYLAQQPHRAIHAKIGYLGQSGYTPFRQWSPVLRALCLQHGLNLTSTTYSDVFDFLFRPTEALQQKLSEIVSRLSRHGEPYAAMHVRTGGEEVLEMAGNKWHHFVDKGSALLTLPATAEMVTRRHGLPRSTKWLLATDDLTFGRRLQGEMPHTFVLSNTRLPLKLGLHIGRGGTAEGAFLTFVDWYILTKSSIAVQAGTSSYSTSAMLYRNDDCSRDLGRLRSAYSGVDLPIKTCTRRCGRQNDK